MSLVKSIGKQKVNVDFNKDFINLFSQKIKSNDVAFINQTLKDLHAADIADLIENEYTCGYLGKSHLGYDTVKQRGFDEVA